MSRLVLSVQDVWTDISPLNPMAKERVGYPTQKPEALLAGIIEASSDPGDLVLDCFVRKRYYFSRGGEVGTEMDCLRSRTLRGTHDSQAPS